MAFKLGTSSSMDGETKKKFEALERVEYSRNEPPPKEEIEEDDWVMDMDGADEVDSDEVGAPNSFHRDPGDLLAQGYLRKLRGWGQNRLRWFELTTKIMSFYTKDSGERIASCLINDVMKVADDDGNKFQISTCVPFGRTHNTKMLLEAPNAAVKKKWVELISAAKAKSVSKENAILAEGYLVKVQTALDKLSRTRWFILSKASLSYAENECDTPLAFCTIDNIDKIVIVSETIFQLEAKQPFSKSGSSSMTLETKDLLERDRWLDAFRSIIPGQVRVSSFSPLKENVRSEDDHFGVVIGKEQSKAYLEAQDDDAGESQGNRFIQNDDL